MILIGDWATEKKLGKWCSRGAVVLANLEGPILPSSHTFVPVSKAGPSVYSCNLPNEIGHSVFSLANNHIMDYNLSGLKATLESLEQRGFKACGAGKDVYNAREPILVEDKGIQVGIIACCEAQFGVARRNLAGVAEFGPWIFRSIRELRETVSAVIVSVHAAVEDSPWPYPYLQELFRSYIDAGATVVHGHHAHVPQGYEEYGGGLIFYGMGNFAVDPDKWRNYPNGLWSLGAEINFSVKPLHWRLLTFEIRHEPDTETICVEESSDAEHAVHLAYLCHCNRPLAEPELLTALWQEVALRLYHHYGARYLRFAPPPSIRSVGRRSYLRRGLSMIKQALRNELPKVSRPAQPSQNDYLLWYHMFACESHRQMMVTALGVLGGEIEDLRTEETRRLADEMMPWSVGVVPV